MPDIAGVNLPASSASGDAGGVVATGLGLVTALGPTAETWDGLIHGRSGIGALRRFEAPPGHCRAAGEIDALAPPHGLRVAKHAKFMSRSTLAGMTAALEALGGLRDRLARLDPYRVAIVVGSGETGLDLEEFFPALSAASGDGAAADYARLGGVAARLVDPYFSLRTLSNGLAALLAIELRARGETWNYVHGPTAGARALAEGCRALEEDRADVVVLVGCDALVSVVTWLAWETAGRLSHEDASLACRPFDARRDGPVLGEAGAALVLERADDARRRGARVLGTIAGVGFAVDEESDAERGATDDAAGPAAARRAIDEAMSCVGTEPALVMAFGDASPEGDRGEAAALAGRFGDRVPVTTPTGATGLVGAATPIVQACLALLALRTATAPPVTRLERAGVAGLDLVIGRPRALDGGPTRTALCVSRSFCGEHAAVLVAGS